MGIWGWLAAVSSGGVFLLHVVLGGRENVPPLLGSSVPWGVRMTHYYCWHLVSLTLAMMTAGFAYAAYVPDGWDVGFTMTVLSASFMAWSMALGMWKRPRPWYRLPQWVLFLVVTVAALPGLL